MRIILPAVFVILLANCSKATINYYPQTVNSWKSGNATTLIEKWGSPTKKITTYTGNTIYLYKNKNYHYHDVNSKEFNDWWYTNNRTRNINLDPTIAMTCVTAFETDIHGQIVGVQMQGHGCYGNEIFHNLLRNPT